jgi:hypothetical protein
MEEIASRERMLARGTEHGFSLGGAGGGGSWGAARDDQPEVV